jgi:virginiamycin B lyase
MRRLATLLAAASLAAIAAAPSPAGAAIYWGAETGIGSANLDGSEAMSSYPYGERVTLAPGANVCGVAVNRTDLFWADRNGSIGKMGLAALPAGPLDILKEQVPLDEAFVSGLTAPCGVALDAGHVYWASAGGLAIGRANLDGSGVERNFIVGAARPCGVAVDGSHVYWANSLGNSIGRANLDGTGVEESFITGAAEPCGVAVDGSHVYWANEGAGTIGRANLDGSGADQSLVSGVEDPCGVAVDGTYVYWSRELRAGHRIGRARLDGSAVEPSLVNGLLRRSQSCGIAVDSRVWRPPPPPPSYPFFLGRVKHRSRGVAYVTAKAPAEGGGTLTVTSRGLEWRLLPAPVRERGYLLWQLKLWPARGGPGRKVRRALGAKGRANVTLEVTYQEPGKGPYLDTLQLTLLREIGRKTPHK